MATLAPLRSLLALSLLPQPPTQYQLSRRTVAAAAIAAAALPTINTQYPTTTTLSPPLRPALALEKAPSTDELNRLSLGLARVEYLLEHWDELTTVCNGVSAGGDLEDKQVARTQNQARCYKTPLKVQQYIGASSTLDPLFRADKLLIRAAPLVADPDKDAYNDAIDAFITKQQISSTMAYTSSWSGIENPNGSVDQIESNLLEAKREVLATQETLRTIVKLLNLPPARYTPA